MVIIDQPQTDLTIQLSGVNDDLDYLNGLGLWQINKIAEDATITAHQESGVPIIELHLAELDVTSIGSLFYFFEYAVFISATLAQINPFDQPGVEAYKQLMFAGLGK